MPYSPPGTIKASATPVELAAREVTPPPSAAVFARPDSVTLKAGGTNTVMQSLRVKRIILIATLRANPVITLGRENDWRKRVSVTI